MALTLGAACGGDLAVAPAAVPSPAERTTGAATTSGAELLVLVDETGAARRVLIVRDERDPRRRQVERLGFRTLTREAMAAGQVDAATRAAFASGEAKGLPVRYQRTDGGWTPALDAQVGDVVAAPRSTTPRAATTTGVSNASTVRATVDSALASLEATMNQVLADDLREGSDGSGQDTSGAAYLSPDSGDPCADERSDANWERFWLIGKTIGIAVGFVLMAEAPALWPKLPAATVSAAAAMGEAYGDYSRAMRELRQCEAAH